jgi:2-hydroxycyclohexanecarboxyl-CoA dehydrogenase
VRCDQCRLFGYASFADITVESGQRLVDVNLTGTFHCCQIALPDMVAAGWGRIVMISVEPRRGTPFAAHYAASKGALLTLTKSLAANTPHGITVNIPPSGIETPMQHARRPPATCLPMRPSPPTSPSDTWEPRPISPPRSDSCARTRPVHHRQTLGVNGDR